MVDQTCGQVTLTKDTRSSGQVSIIAISYVRRVTAVFQEMAISATPKEDYRAIVCRTG